MILDLEPDSTYQKMNEAELGDVALAEYYTERILFRVPALAEVAAIAASHALNQATYHMPLLVEAV